MPCQPGSGPSRSPLFRLHMARVGDRARPLDLAGRSQAREQHRVQLLPYPARCHSSRRRQHVTPEPKPSSGGRCVQAIPVCNTNKIPCSANRSSSRLRPGYRKRRCFLGNSGSNNSHSSSETIHGAARHPSQLDDDCRRRSSPGNGSLHSEMTPLEKSPGNGAFLFALRTTPCGRGSLRVTSVSRQQARAQDCSCSRIGLKNRLSRARMPVTFR